MDVLLIVVETVTSKSTLRGHELSQMVLPKTTTFVGTKIYEDEDCVLLAQGVSDHQFSEVIRIPQMHILSVEVIDG